MYQTTVAFLSTVEMNKTLLMRELLIRSCSRHICFSHNANCSRMNRMELTAVINVELNATRHTPLAAETMDPRYLHSKATVD